MCHSNICNLVYCMITYFVLELDMKINETHTENDNRQNEIELENGIIFKYFFYIQT